MGKLDIKNDWKKIIVSSVIGAAAAVALSAALVTLMASLVSSGRAGEGAEKTLCIISAVVSTLAGAFIARARAHGASLLTGAGTALIVILAKLLLALLSDESTALDNTDLTFIVCILCSGVAAGAISPHRRRRRRR